MTARAYTWEKRMGLAAVALGIVASLGVYEKSLVKQADLVASVASMKEQTQQALKPVEQMIQAANARLEQIDNRERQHTETLAELRAQLSLLRQGVPH